MIRDSVERRSGLIHGKLWDGQGGFCAIGAFFEDNPKLSLQNGLIDEVAAYNDSIPKGVGAYERRNKVLRWLTAKLEWLRGPRAAKLPPRHKKKPAKKKKVVA